MNFELKKYENYSLGKLVDEKLDSSSSPDLKTELTKHAQEGAKSLIMDMSEVKYVDSSGLSALLVGNRAFDQQGAFVLFGLNDHVEKLIKISQLDKVLNILPTKEEAVDFVFMTELEKGLQAQVGEEE